MDSWNGIVCEAHRGRSRRSSNLDCYQQVIGIVVDASPICDLPEHLPETGLRCLPLAHRLLSTHLSWCGMPFVVALNFIHRGFSYLPFHHHQHHLIGDGLQGTPLPNKSQWVDLGCRAPVDLTSIVIYSPVKL